MYVHVGLRTTLVVQYVERRAPRSARRAPGPLSGGPTGARRAPRGARRPCARACNILWFCLSVQNPLFRRLSHLWSTYTLCNPMVPKQHLHRFIYSFVLWYGVRLFPLVRDAP